MTPIERMRELCALINRYANAYYQDDTPLISDAEYDALYDELVALETSSGTVLDESPTRRVGAQPITAFEPHTHIARLYSLDKVQSVDALREWCNKTKAQYPDAEFSLEYKLDGLTVNLTYDNGRLVCASTRGNGVVGEDITAQVMTISTVPLTIPFKGRFEVQGEGHMRLSVLEKINRASTEPLKNARNAAAGALRNLDPRITAKRHLDLYCYNIGYIEGKVFDDHHQMMKFITDNGLPTSPYLKYYFNADELISEVESIRRGELDILIDGMVVKIADMSARREMGQTERFPRWAIAYKFPAEETTTVVENIVWQVGRTGKLTPLAIVRAVELCGATIKRATLNNYDDILRKRVNIGSRVFLRRSNDVIPEILGSVTDEGSHVLPPAICPDCGAHVEQRGAHLFCTNTLSCKPQIVARLAHFASRDAMDIDAFSDKTAALMVDKLQLTSIPMLYELTAERLTALDKFAQKKANNLINAIEASKSRPLSAFIYALGIPNIGIKTAKDLSKTFVTLDALRTASDSQLVDIPDVGAVMADSIVKFFSDEEISSDIDKMLALGVSPQSEAATPVGAAFSGMTVVVTGKLESMGRSDAEGLIETHGGKTASSVSKNTSLVVAGEAAGSKLDKATALGIRVIGEAEFIDIINSDKS